MTVIAVVTVNIGFRFGVLKSNQSGIELCVATGSTELNGVDGCIGRS